MMKFRFQSFVDISTSAQSMQVIQWSVGGKEVYERCRHLFGAYKYFKLGKISVKMVPASTLPVDPQGLSYASDDPQTVDPRDQMTPGLIRITNGEDIFTRISVLSEDQQIKVFNTMMLDPRWSKFMLQSGFRRTAVPLYWQVGQLSQDKYPGATINVPWLINDGTGLQSNGTVTVREVYQNGVKESTEGASSARGLFQTGHKGRLGFLPTDFYQQYARGDGTKYDIYGANNIPEVSVITCILPKAYKTIYYYRVFITEEVIFSGLRATPMFDGSNPMYMGLDNFMIGNPLGTLPTTNIGILNTNKPFNNGGDLP